MRIFQAGDIANCIDISGDGGSLINGARYVIQAVWPGDRGQRIRVFNAGGYIECDGLRFEIFEEAKDKEIKADCGCTVTFTADSGYLEYKVDAICEKHKPVDLWPLIENCRLIRDHECRSPSTTPDQGARDQ